MTHVTMQRGAMKQMGLGDLLSLSLREFRVRDGAFLCPSEWLCNGEGAAIAELKHWCIQSGSLGESSGMWAVKAKLLSSDSAPHPPWLQRMSLLPLCPLASLGRGDTSTDLWRREPVGSWGALGGFPSTTVPVARLHSKL